MTDAQMISIVIAISTSLRAVVYNNSRLTDVGKQIDDLRGAFNKRFDDMNCHVDGKFSLMLGRFHWGKTNPGANEKGCAE